MKLSTAAYLAIALRALREISRKALPPANPRIPRGLPYENSLPLLVMSHPGYPLHVAIAVFLAKPETPNKVVSAARKLFPSCNPYFSTVGDYRKYHGRFISLSSLTEASRITISDPAPPPSYAAIAAALSSAAGFTGKTHSLQVV